MSSDTFLYFFLAIAVVDLYFFWVQRTSVLICRAGGLPTSAGSFLNPRFIRLAFPLSLIKWGWVVYWAWSGSTSDALIAFVASWLSAIFLPIPARLTLPPIFKQIERVRTVDSKLANTLADAAMAWEIRGAKG